MKFNSSGTDSSGVQVIASPELVGAWRRLLERKSHMLLAVGLTIWGIATLLGFAVMLAYANSAGPVAAARSTWPTDSRLRADSARANLVLLIHPRCPCSRATLGELQEILRLCRGRVTAQVVFLKPRQFSDEWARTDLWHRAAEMPDVRVSFDEDGHEAKRFGATTSGHVALFDDSGGLMFQGGITVSRGHRGDNVGRRKVIDLLTGTTTEPAELPVFGCSLFNDKCVDRAVTQ